MRVLPDNDLEGAEAWSNDGTRLLISGCYDIPADATDCATTFSVVPVDGNDLAVEIDVGGGFPGADSTSHVWAPDDGSILTTPLDAQGLPVSESLLWDPITGQSQPAPWPALSVPSWQRLAR